MKPLKVINLFATADKDGIHLDISHDRQDCENWLSNNDNGACSIIEGFGVAYSDTNVMYEDALDFHYSKEKAETECSALTFSYVYSQM